MQYHARKPCLTIAVPDANHHTIVLFHTTINYF